MPSARTACDTSKVPQTEEVCVTKRASTRPRGPWEPWTHEDVQSVLQCKNTLQIAPSLHYETHLKMVWCSLVL